MEILRIRTVLFIFLIIYKLLLLPIEEVEANSSKEQIAMSCLVGASWQIFSMEPDGGVFTRYSQSASDKMNPSWSSAKQRVMAVTNSGELLIIDLDSRKEQVLDIGISGMTDTTWSADGKNVYFSLSIANSIDANDIWQVNIDTKERRRLTNMKNMQHDPAITHDEKNLIFVSGAGGQDHNLIVLNLETGERRQLTAGQRYHFEPACSVNNEIAFSTNRTGDYEIWITDLVGKQFEQITQSPGMDGQPSWSPDGKKISFVSTRGGYPAVWVMNRDGSNVYQISPEGKRCRGPAWSR